MPGVVAGSPSSNADAVIFLMHCIHYLLPKYSQLNINYLNYYYIYIYIYNYFKSNPYHSPTMAGLPAVAAADLHPSCPLACVRMMLDLSNNRCFFNQRFIK